MGGVRLLPALAAAVLLSACGQQATELTAAQPAPTTPPDLAGHQFDTPHADRVLVAGETTDLVLPTGTLRVTVWGPRTVETQPFAPRQVGHLREYVATFTVETTVLSGTATLAPTDLRLLAIADQDEGGAVKTVASQATTLVSRTLSKGAHWNGTWSARFVEGHGELLLSPGGSARPAALWDFRVEA